MPPYDTLVHSEKNLRDHLSAALGRLSEMATDIAVSRPDLMISRGLGWGRRMPIVRAYEFEESLRDILRDMKKRRGRLISYYRDENWRKTVLDCVEIASRQSHPVQSNAFCFQAQWTYLEDLLRAEPMSDFLRPQDYEYDFSEHCPCRDKVAYLDNVYCIGISLWGLESQVHLGRTVQHLLWERIVSKPSEVSVDLEELEQKDGRFSLEREKDDILKWAWNIASHCHDLGQAFSNVRFKRALKDIERAGGAGRHLGEIINQCVGTSDGDHGPRAAAQLFTDFSRHPYMGSGAKAACLLGLSAICRHNTLLVNIHEDAYPGHLEESEVWDKYPFAAFLATAILLAEIAVRPCWYDVARRDLKVIPWEKLDVKDIVPVTELCLTCEEENPILLFVVGPVDEFEGIVGKRDSIYPPLRGHKRDSVRRALGPMGLALLHEDEAQALESWWDGVPAKPEEGLRPPPSKEDPEIKELREQCENAKEEAREAIQAAEARLKSAISRKTAKFVASGEPTERKPYQTEASELKSVKKRFSVLEERLRQEPRKIQLKEALEKLRTYRRDADSILSKPPQSSSDPKADFSS